MKFSQSVRSPRPLPHRIERSGLSEVGRMGLCKRWLMECAAAVTAYLALYRSLKPDPSIPQRLIRQGSHLMLSKLDRCERSTITDVAVMSAVVIRPQTAQRRSRTDASRTGGPCAMPRTPMPRWLRPINRARKAAVPRVALEEGPPSRGRQIAEARRAAAKRSKTTVTPRNLPAAPALTPGVVSARADGITPMEIMRAIAINKMKPAKRFLRQLLLQLRESAGGIPRWGVAVSQCAIHAPITLPKQPETMTQGMPQIRGGKSTSNSNGTTEATSVGNFAQNPFLPLGATQNWQKARYSAAATHGAISSPFEFSKAAAAAKETSAAVTPKTRETTTIPKVRTTACVSWCGPSAEVGKARVFIPSLIHSQFPILSIHHCRLRESKLCKA